MVRTFTDMESRQAKGSASKLAGSFAVKEAVAKQDYNLSDVLSADQAARESVLRTCR